MTEGTESGVSQFDPAFDFSPFIAFQDERAWAVQKALLFPNIDVFYSLIPKNACTSLLTALAVANGLTATWFQSRNRIHNIQQRFSAFQDLERFNDQSFRMIALRDPFRRAISALGNKLVGTTAENQLDQRFFTQRLNKPIHECRLSEIFRLCDTVPHWLVDQHFAPQWSFLFYDRYDLVIDGDRPVRCIDIRGRQIQLAQHNSHAKPRSDDDVGDVMIGELRTYLKEQGRMPSLAGHRRVFDSVLRRGGNYDRDFQLYAALTSKS